jgi:hypothetical protein
MSIGFIQNNDNGLHERTELSAASKEWLAWQVAEAWELNAALKDAYQVLFKEVHKYAVQLELIDPDNRNAEQEIAEVMPVLRSRHSQASCTLREWNTATAAATTRLTATHCTTDCAQQSENRG